MAMITINRAGKQLGPYSLADVQRYLAEGRIGLNEPACLNGDQRWQPLRALVAAEERNTKVVNNQQPQTPPPRVVVNVRTTSGPVPPSVHWFLILILTMGSGVFGIVWLFVQSAFVKKIDARSKATIYFACYLGCMAVFLVGYLGIKSQLEGDLNLNPDQALTLLVIMACLIAACVFFLMGIYSIRSSLQNYYRDVEPLGTTYSGEAIGLRLNGLLTFFFNVVYIQYHLSKIAKWKELGVLT
jgi:hypothetical protein